MKKLKINVVVTIIYQIVSVFVGLIIPRLILSAFGSDVNGLTYSINQMLSVITYFDFGVSAVAQAALYKPLEDNDIKKINSIYYAIKRYFNILALALIVYTGVLCFYYGYVNLNSFSPIFNITLVLSIALSLIAQYVWGINNQVLLAADQQIYIYTIINIICTILNAAFTYVLIYFNQSIQVVKLVSSIIFLLRPGFLQLYVKKHYIIYKRKNVVVGKLENQWSGLIQHIATTLTSSLDTIVLTLLSTLSNISIYNVYTFPLNGVRVLIDSLSGGYKSYFGHILINSDHDFVLKKFKNFEILIHFFCTIFTAVALNLLVPFVMIYTRGVTDANYNNLLFAVFITLAYSIMTLKVPYTTIINAAGHFKQTQNYCIIEVILNAVISVTLVRPLGLMGVAIGTCVAVTYRIIASVSYLSKNILNRKNCSFYILLIFDAAIVVMFSLIVYPIRFSANNYLTWAIKAIIDVIIVSVLFIGLLYLVNRKICISFIKSFKEK